MEKSFIGIISSEGGLKIYEKTQFQDHCKAIKGKRVIISIVSEDPAASKFSIIYFEKVICQSFIEIFKNAYGELTTIEVVSERLRSWCPVSRKGEELRTLEDLNQEELNYLIKNSKSIAGIEFDYFIKD